MTDEREFGWDDEIQNDDAGGRELVPDGVYPFEIVDLKRERYEPKQKGKLPPCNKAVLTVRVHHAPGEHVDLNHNLFLHSRCEGRLCAFFKAIGQRKHGEPLKPDWNRVIGTRGTCRVAVRDYVGRDGEKRQSNDIKAFLDPAKVPPVPPVAPPAADTEF